MTFTYFTIFGAMRTGSNLREHSLDQYARLAGHGELYNPHFIGKPERREFLSVPLADRNADPVGLLHKLIEATPQTIPGFRIFDNHDRRVIDYAARDAKCAKIILTRSPIDSFISLQIAQDTGQWMLVKDENRRVAKMRFEADKYEAYMAKRKAHYAFIRRAAQKAGQPVFEIDDEDLTDLSVLNGVARFIGSSKVKANLPDKIRRQNPPAWEDKVENVDDLRAYASSGGFTPPDTDPEPQPKFGGLTELIASKTFDAIYAPIPGAGMGEVRKVLTEAAAAAGDAEAKLAAGMKKKHLIRRRWRGAFVFSFIRHPAERLHDVFIRRIAQADAGAYSMVQMMMARDYRGPGPGEMMSSTDALLTGLDAFISFVESNLSGHTALRVDPAWTPQSTLLALYARETPIDFIGRIENLDDDLSFVLSRMKSPPIELAPKLKASLERIGHEMPKSIWLTRERETRIRKIYERDYARLGYDFISPD